jgi:hypothetical protein
MPPKKGKKDPMMMFFGGLKTLATEIGITALLSKLPFDEVIILLIDKNQFLKKQI